MKYLLTFLVFLHVFGLKSQTVLPGTPQLSWDDFVEEYQNSLGIDDDTPAPIDRGGTTLDFLDEIRLHPLNLNTATRQQLLELSLLSAAQVDSLLTYRQRLRAFSSPSDLMMVHGLEAQQRRWLSLFVYVGDTLRTRETFVQQLRTARHTLDFRAQLPLPRSPLFGDASQSAVDEKHRYLGLPWSNTLRYRVQSREAWRAGVTFDHDVGEPFAAYRNLPFDHTSFFVEKHHRDRQQQWLVGDFHAQFAQGLLVGHRFATFVQPYFLDLPRHLTRLTPNTSTDEAHYLRGLAWQQQFRRCQITAFASYRQLDANLKDGFVHSLYENGLHRNLLELSHRNRLGQFVVGAHAAWKTHQTTWGVGMLAAQYSRPFPQTKGSRGIPSPMVGQTAAGASLDFAHYAQTWSVQSELALDKSGGIAFATFARKALTASDVVLLQLRHFSPHYVAPMARTFQQASHVQNETGALLGYETSRWRHLQWQSFVQIAHYPLPTHRAAAPSSGIVAQTSVVYQARKTTQWTLRYRLSSVQQTIPHHAPLLQWTTRQTLRLQHRYALAHFSWQTALDAAMAHQQVARTAPELGWMLSTRAQISPSSSWRASAFLSYFSTPSFAARLYAYVPQLPSTGAFPTFYGRGWSGAVVAGWVPSRAWSLSARLSVVHHFVQPHSANSSSSRSTSPLTFHCGLWLRHRF